MNHQTAVNARPARDGFRFTYVALACSLVLFVGSAAYSAWARHREREADLPVPALETVVVALRNYHRQTGRFPDNFRQLDERVWKGERRSQISPDGKSLNSPASRYYYTLHAVSPSRAAGAHAGGTVKAALWAVPTGPRSSEAATHFWYVTPDRIECWMGPALTAENVSAVKTIPTEQQLALLVMTRQPQGAPDAPSTKGILPALGF
jgi:hypothetical protein